MKEIVLVNTFDLENKDFNIKEIKDMSCENISRIRIIFNSGYQLSIIRGPYTYGGPDGLFEIAPFDENGKMNGKILGIIDDDVEGYLTEKEVVERIIEMSNLRKNLLSF